MKNIISTEVTSITTAKKQMLYLDSDDMEKIATLDKDCPSMLDTRKISEVKRVYDYLNNPVLTSL